MSTELPPVMYRNGGGFARLWMRPILMNLFVASGVAGVGASALALIGVGGEVAHRAGWIEPDGVDVIESTVRGTFDGIASGVEALQHMETDVFEVVLILLAYKFITSPFIKIGKKRKKDA